MSAEAGTTAGHGQSTPVLSLLHVRPLLASEQTAACCNIVSVGENETVNVQGRQYAFDCVIGEGGHPRQHMCEQYLKPLVRNVCNGVNAAVLAYGQTSSGKTYTMGIGKEQLQALSCGDDEAVGDLVIPYALRQLFANVDAARGKRAFTLLVSFVEVYMEKYYDLLARRQPVAAKTRCDGEVMLVGAQLRQVDSMEDVIRLLQIGGMARITKGTNQNDRSSRSHAVLTIHVQSRAAAAELNSPASPAASGVTSALCSSGPARAGLALAFSASSGSPDATEPSASCKLTAPPPVRACEAVDGGGGGAALSAAMAAPPLAAKLHLVDLAGSESVGRAGTVGLAAKEGNNINLSLMTLRNLIQLLAAPKAAARVLPYRDSKLTTLLRDALGGNSSTLFVACVSPADANAAMTVSTLEFATTARRIRTKPAVNIGGAGSTEVLELHRIILKLRSELDLLRRQAAPCSLSPRRISAVRTSMTFSAAVAAASMQPSMQTPSPALLAGSGSPAPSLSQLQQQQASYLMSTLSAGRRNSVATANGTPPVPLPIRMSANGVIMSSAASALGTYQGNPVAAATATAGRTTSPGSAVAWGGSDIRCSAFAQAHQQVCAGSTADSEESVDGQEVAPETGEGRERGATEDVADTAAAGGQPSIDGGKLNKPLGKAGRITRRRRQRRRRTGGRARDTDHAGQVDDPPCTSCSSGSAGASMRLRRSRSSRNADPSDSDSDGGSNVLLSSSSYDGSEGSSHDDWHGVAELQQRIVLLEAENEHLQKHVGHLSAVISELRAQLDDAHTGRVASTTPLSVTPGVSRPVRSSASGSLLGQSMLTATTARLQRIGASAGGVSRMSRTPFSPSQQHLDSPFSALQRPSPMWESTMRMSCGEGTPPWGYYGPRRTGMGAAAPHDEASPRTGLEPPLPRGSRPGGADSSRPESSPFMTQRRYISDNGVIMGSTASPFSAMVAQHFSALATPESCGAAAARAYAVASPGAAAAPTAAVCQVWQAVDNAADGGPMLMEGVGVGAGCGALQQVAEEPQEESEEEVEQLAAAAVPCGGAVEAEGSTEDTTGVALVLSDEESSGEHPVVPQESPAQPPSPVGSGSARSPVALDIGENRLLAMLTWIGQRVADSESQLAAHQATLRRLLAEQGLTVGAAAGDLPSLDTLQCFAATQLAGVEAELSGMGACSHKGSLSTQGSSSPSGPALAPSVEAGIALAPAPKVEDEASDAARRVEMLRARMESLRDLQMGLKWATELEASLELQREVQMVVSVYAGLSSGDDQGVATGPAVARAAATAEQQLLSLRRQRRQQIVKDAVVAREKLRELELLAGPPTPLEFGVLLQAAGGSSGGGSATPGPSGPPSLTLSHSQRSAGAASWLALGVGAGSGQFSLDAGEDDDELELERTSGAATPKAGVAATGGGFTGPVTAVTSPALPPLPPLPPQPVQQQQQTPSIFSHFLPALSPISGWRLGGNKDAAQAQPAQQQQPSAQHVGLPQQPRNASGQGGSQRRIVLQLSQVGPWLDALLDYETRLQQYNTVLIGALQERETVNGQLQEVEQEMALLVEAAAVEAGTSFSGAAGWHNGVSQGGARNGRTDGGASFAGWVSSPMRAVLKGAAGVSVQQHGAALTARKAKLQKRMEDLCMEVTSLQLAITEAQESRSAATERDDWWACVPSLGLARPALRLLLERASEYRAAFLDSVARTDRLEQQVEELGLQYQEAEARLAAHSLELTATRAAALAAMAGPGLNESFSDAVALLLQQQPHGSGGGGPGEVSSYLASPSTQRASSTCLAAEVLGAAVLGAGHSTAGSPATPPAELGGGTPSIQPCTSG